MSQSLLDTGGVTILNGDCREVLRSLPDESVHCCVTSPPYWGLRGGGFGNGGVKTTGWRPTCAHEHSELDLVPCTVLDPFGGSGTVGKVATRLGRRSILVELNPEYITIAEKRTAQRGLGI